ncbi:MULTISPECIES: hypothetical protein [unclassified Massilia]|uniref:hypothetical protein n=1 Tax=unclassified Massilia TaxID=2609279 RepID=UPI00178321BE|nr:MULTISPECIES: hypothetical protein [unclassified Massilia]MBD8528956.1 hypothetical protein [Massilia sp. CFBP 13647]MBD8673598.1 hypothetical protein [Massilia sp. CFBP 13721]
MQAEFWGILHDGGIANIAGTVPGTISIDISIGYLRQQFPDKGTGFKVVLTDCTRFEFAEYDRELLHDVESIVERDPEILNLEHGGDPVVVNCTMGTLTLLYATASVYLDSGTPVSFEELSAASSAYWEAWKARTRRQE